jgi:GMP synthase (glutamine-hydrolysing)
MKTAVAIRHVHFEDVGTLLPVLRERGYQVEYKEAGRDDLRDIDPETDLLIFLGAPIGVYEDATYPFLREELALAERRLSEDRPTLGICLGAQIMVRALGARVYPGGTKEIGWKEVTLSASGMASPLRSIAATPVLHWHGDTFDLPKGAERLASTSLYPEQSFTWGRCSLAMQFHPEVGLAGLERWHIGHACELASAGISVDSLRNDAREYAPLLESRAPALWRDWLGVVEAGGS